MIGLIRMFIRLTWLAVIVLGVKRLVEIAQGGAGALTEHVDTLTDGIESGRAANLGEAFERLHEALHRRQAHRAPGTDPFGEM